MTAEISGDRGRRHLLKDVSLSSVVAGLLAVVVSYSGPMVIVLAAAKAGHLTPGQTTSWVWAVSLGSGLTCVLLSLWTRTPVVTAFSTPGAALLVTTLGDHPYGAAIGAFALAGLLTAVVGFSGLFGRFMSVIPTPIVSGVLAGILFAFGVDAFRALGVAPLVVGAVVVGYLVVKRFSARYAVLGGLLLGVPAALATGTRLSSVSLEWARPEWTTPQFTVASVISIGIPMFMVTMASQNAPGLAVLRTAGYPTPDRLLVGTTGVASVLLAPFGSHAINLAAITAAICTGEEAHPDPRRRYTAAVACGAFYVVVGAFGATLLGVFLALPTQLVAAVAGVALLGALGAAVTDTTSLGTHREGALIAFLTTASGVTLLGIGSAFWGLLFGTAAHFVVTRKASADAPG
ncbi:benzoate/H(+) symporter BenE family transporter [Umezawaea sp. Da 62-37]|uniref:benzoate/H(+) symporter BenE family transporter n=1 Tax=Umezawaea sp. Da 62-37 TaxID=3075927 RepID=UPI0028F7065D|nr:benzoate/H(+) symporter BenE family transporter [Umezawaea sp. Da 62-37]WNV87079.1 benzoate/H(+) symporter BenE family transporter [Umezawaea sp. Da 62-37]